LASKATSSLGLVVDLNEHLEADCVAGSRERPQLVPIERRGDQQHTVGAHQPGVEHVVRRR
jgi:hypothetical protein